MLNLLYMAHGNAVMAFVPDGSYGAYGLNILDEDENTGRLNWCFPGYMDIVLSLNHSYTKLNPKQSKISLHG